MAFLRVFIAALFGGILFCYLNVEAKMSPKMMAHPLITRFKTDFGDACISACVAGREESYWCWSEYAVPRSLEVSQQLQTCSPKVGVSVKGNRCVSDCEPSFSLWYHALQYSCYVDMDHTVKESCGPSKSTVQDAILETDYAWVGFKTWDGFSCEAPCKHEGGGDDYVCEIKSFMFTKACSPEPNLTIKGKVCVTPCKLNWSKHHRYCYTDTTNWAWDYCGLTTTTYSDVLSRNYSLVGPFSNQRTKFGDICETECKPENEDENSIHYCWILEYFKTMPAERIYGKRVCSPSVGIAIQGQKCTSECFYYNKWFEPDYYWCYVNDENTRWDFCGPQIPENSE